MNFFCFLCNNLYEEISSVIFHLKYEHYLSERHGLQVQCVSSEHCKSIFCTFNSLRRHSQQCGIFKGTEIVCRENCIDSNTKIVGEEKPDLEIHIASNALSNSHFSDIETPTISIENHEPYPHLPLFCEQLNINCNTEASVSRIMQLFENTIFEGLKEFECYILNAHKDIQMSRFEENSNIFRASYKSQLSKFSNKYKRENMITQSAYFIQPEPRSLGGRWIMKKKRGNNSLARAFVQQHFQYIPILKRLRNLFKNELFTKLYFSNNNKCSVDLIEGFCCSDSFALSSFFQQNGNALQIQILYDDFEVVNPLGSKKSIHKIGALYFTIRNLPYQYNSKLENIHLLALFNCANLKNENVTFNDVLRPIENDIALLDRNGIDVNGINVKGTIVSITHDNLGANKCLVFVTSFRATHYCRFCTVNRKEAAYMLDENSALLRKR
ncbi:uncharacterized protein [Eurosta solidaginis]|uniref:uncharacterized protein n=1 Tax=Eurosta solidaginis TaxID=178769 RepID=UPI003530EAFC